MMMAALLSHTMLLNVEGILGADHLTFEVGIGDSVCVRIFLPR